MHYLRIDPRNFPNPTDKALASARYLKSQQRATAERYEEFRGESAPAWMRATAEEIARHIDLVYYYATQHRVYVDWKHFEYGMTPEQIEVQVMQKQKHPYRIGDLVYAGGSTVRHVAANGLLVVDYHRVYYICRNNVVGGIYREKSEYRITFNNLTREQIEKVRFADLHEAIHCAEKVVFPQMSNYIVL